MNTRSDNQNGGVLKKKMVVKKVENEFCVMHSHGEKAGTPIKCFPTRIKAEAMHKAIQVSKKEAL